MNLRQLTYFAAIARLGSQTEASQMLNVSQPALGVQIRALEDELGLRLFTRRSRGMELTEAGTRLLRHADLILKQLAEAKSDMAAFSKRAGLRLTLGVAPTPGKAIMPKFLAACREDATLSVAVREGLSTDLIAQVTKGNLDLALCYDPSLLPNTTVIPLFHEDLVLVHPNELESRFGGEIAFRDLAGLPLILDGPGQITRQLIDRLAQSCGVALNVTMEIEATSLKWDFMRSQGWYSIVPYGLFKDETVDGNFAWARIVDPPITRTLCLLTGAALSDRDLQAFCRVLCPVLQDRIDHGGLHWRWTEGANNLMI